METRIVPCEKCGGDGGWENPISHDPFRDTIRYSKVVCEACDGSGVMEIEVEPIDWYALSNGIPTVMPDGTRVENDDE